MLATVDILHASFVVNYIFLISFVVQGYNVAQYVLFLHLYCVTYTPVIHVHWIRESKPSVSVEPCFLKLGIYEPKPTKPILRHPFLLQRSLNNRKCILFFALRNHYGTSVVRAEARTSPILMFTSQISKFH